MLRGFVSSWNRDRVPNRTSTSFRSAADRRAAPSASSRREPELVGAIEWLAVETRKHGQDGLSTDTIEKVLKAKFQTTELRIADPIVTALNRPEEFSEITEYAHSPACTVSVDGRLAAGCPGCGVAREQLVIRPNPLAKREVRVECCGGCDPE
jgi:hypothetical protein